MPYGVSEATEIIDYDEMEKIALSCKPKLIVSGASAYPRTIDFARIRAICDKVGALMMVDIAHIAGLVAAGLHPSPVPYADFVTTTTHKTLRGPRGGAIMCKERYGKAIDKAIFPGTQGRPAHARHRRQGGSRSGRRFPPEFKAYQAQIVRNAAVMAKRFTENGVRLVSGGTDNHLMLVDLRKEGMTGKELEALLDRAHITANKNTIPFETTSPFVTSGVRIGTPAITSRGMKEAEAAEIADLVTAVIRKKEDAVEEVSARVAALCARFPPSTNTTSCNERKNTPDRNLRAGVFFV